jgi:transposase
MWRVRLRNIKRREGTKALLLLPKRWIIERMFAQLMRYSRLSQDYKYPPGTGKAMIGIAMMHLMIRRLAPW